MPASMTVGPTSRDSVCSQDPLHMHVENRAAYIYVILTDKQLFFLYFIILYFVLEVTTLCFLTDTEHFFET